MKKQLPLRIDSDEYENIRKHLSNNYGELSFQKYVMLLIRQDIKNNKSLGGQDDENTKKGSS